MPPNKFAKKPLTMKAVNPHIVSFIDTGSATTSLRNINKRPLPIMESYLKACESKDLSGIRALLATGLSVNYAEPARANRTPVFYAAKFNFQEAVCELLEKGANPHTGDDSGITPLHTAACHGCLHPLETLLKAGVDPNAKDSCGRTSLHFATRALSVNVEDNAMAIVEALLNAGATVSVKDHQDRTPLHGAVVAGNTEVISLLLSRKGASLVSDRDTGGRTSLHHAVLGARSLAAVKILLQCNPQIDARDDQGRTALHYVAGRPINYVDKEFDGDCLELLLSFGASVHVKDDDGFNALSLALQRTMWWSRQSPKDEILHSVQLLVHKGSAIIDSFDMWRIVETFPSLVMVAMNQSIRANTSAKDSPHFKIVFDFRPLTVSTRLLAERKRLLFTPVAPTDELPIPPPLLNDSEISMLHYIYWAGHKNILRHPLCSAFLHLKWLKVRKLFVINVLLYLLFVLALTIYIVSLCALNFAPSGDLSGNATQNSTNITAQNSTTITAVHEIYKPEIRNGLWFILLFFLISFIIKESLQIGHSPSIYIRHKENYMDILILICVAMLMFPSQEDLWTCRVNVSTIAVIVSWARLMLFLGQFPSCGVYIVMFSTVCKTVLQFLSMYIPLLIAFALGFYILLNKIASFDGILTSFVTTMIMMAGEIEYDDKITDNVTLTYKLFPCLVLLIFLLLIYIILSNLLVALAVNDMNAIQQRSELLRLSRQVELMVTVESFLKSPFTPTALRKYIQKQFSISHRHSEALIAVLPNQKHGYVERLFLKMLLLCRFRALLTKIFEHFVLNFIPPDTETSLPSTLLQEAIQLALNELEIEKRDKLFVSKSYQLGSLSQKGLNKNQKSLNKNLSYFSHFPKRESLQYSVRDSALWMGENEADGQFGGPRQLGIIQQTPSIKASMWRRSIRREANKNLESVMISSESTKEIEELRKSISTLQNSVKILTTMLSSSQEVDHAKRRSYPVCRPKLPISPLAQTQSHPVKHDLEPRLDSLVLQSDESKHDDLSEDCEETKV